MFIRNGSRFNPYQPFTTPDGVQYATFPMERAVEFGVSEIPDPQKQDDKWYYNTDQDTDPFIISTMKNIDQLKQTKLADLANLRYAKETGGVTLPNGAKIQTDREAQAQITGALNAISNGFITNIKWKTPEGFVELGAQEIAGIAGAVASHVQACFANEATHATAIQGLTDGQAVIDYDITAGWPV